MKPNKVDQAISLFLKKNLAKKFVVMVSGGVDSMVLAHALARHTNVQKLCILHINHNTRESNTDDEKLVQKFCTKSGAKFVLHTLSGNKIQSNKESKWRDLRQKIAAKTAQQFGATKILTAHHAGDLVETMIFRLTKGSGIAGLSPFDMSTKPLVGISKSDIIQYAAQNRIDWNEDPTNNTNDHERNMIRNQVIPTLKIINPNLEKTFIRQAKNFGETYDFLLAETPAPVPTPVTDFQNWSPTQRFYWCQKITKKIFSYAEFSDFQRWILGSPQGLSQKELGQTLFIIQADTITFTSNQSDN